MRRLAVAAALASLGWPCAIAQTTPPATPPAASGVPEVPLPSIVAPPGATGTPSSDAPNAPVITPLPNPNAGLASTPEKGANSFTQSQARARIVGHGFTDVASLAQDGAGVWRGTAMRDGKPVHVWLDFRGNVGIQ